VEASVRDSLRPVELGARASGKEASGKEVAGKEMPETEDKREPSVVFHLVASDLIPDLEIGGVLRVLGSFGLAVFLGALWSSSRRRALSKKLAAKSISATTTGIEQRA
jgi:hypothetical protein